MSLSCVIVEDQTMFLQMLHNMLRAVPDLRVVATAQNEEQGIIAVEEHRQYLASFILTKSSPYNGHSEKDSGITTAKDVEFVGIVSQGKSLPFDLNHTLQAGDEYVLHCCAHACARLLAWIS